jgi:hypothetical protein
MVCGFQSEGTGRCTCCFIDAAVEDASWQRIAYTRDDRRKVPHGNDYRDGSSAIKQMDEKRASFILLAHWGKGGWRQLSCTRWSALFAVDQFRPDARFLGGVPRHVHRRPSAQSYTWSLHSLAMNISPIRWRSFPGRHSLICAYTHPWASVLISMHCAKSLARGIVIRAAIRDLRVGF